MLLRTSIRQELFSEQFNFRSTGERSDDHLPTFVRWESRSLLGPPTLFLICYYGGRYTLDKGGVMLQREELSRSMNAAVDLQFKHWECRRVVSFPRETVRLLKFRKRSALLNASGIEIQIRLVEANWRGWGRNSWCYASTVFYSLLLY